MLIREHGGETANLNQAIGYERNASKLSRLRNQNARTDRPGKFFNMGEKQARELELKLNLPEGWMDTPPTQSELHGEHDPRAVAIALVTKMPVAKLPDTVQVLTIFAQPDAKTGT